MRRATRGETQLGVFPPTLTVSAASHSPAGRPALLSRFIFSRDTIPLRWCRLAAVAKSEGQSRGVTAGWRATPPADTVLSTFFSRKDLFFSLPPQRCSARVCLPRLAAHHFLLMTFSHPHCCSLSCCVPLISLGELLSCLARLSGDCCGPGLRKAH